MAPVLNHINPYPAKVKNMVSS